MLECQFGRKVYVTLIHAITAPQVVPANKFTGVGKKSASAVCSWTFGLCCSVKRRKVTCFAGKATARGDHFSLVL